MRTNKSNTLTRELLLALLKRAVEMLESDTDFSQKKFIWLTEQEAKENGGDRWIDQKYSPSSLYNLLKLIRAESIAYEKECRGK